MNYIRIICYSLCFILMSQSSFAQTIPQTEAEAKEELAKRGLDEAEVRKVLLENGIDIDKLDELTPDQLIKMEQIIKELENKKNDASGDSDEITVKIESDKPLGDTIIPFESNQENLTEEKDAIQIADEEIRENLNDGPIFGQHLFRDNSLQLYREAENVRAADNYILGVGDELTISVWGSSQLEQTHIINSQGYIKILDGNQKVSLKGLTFADAKQKLMTTFKNYYRFSEEQFEVVLNFSRTVKIGIFGEVINPGTVVIPAINTAFNALVAANGPSDKGSVRNIRLIKKGGEVKMIDVYELMEDPSISGDYYIDNDDNIYVPLADKVIQIRGAVKRPAKYELKKGEKLFELIKFAGGLENNAFKKTIQLNRYEDDERFLRDINYSDISARNQNFELKDGDIITIEFIEDNIKNIVTINGQVQNEGMFERNDGMKVLDLVNLAGLQEESYTDAVYLIRTNPDQTIEFEKINLSNILRNPASSENLILQNKDKLTIWSKDRFLDVQNIAVSGAVRFPNEYPYDNSQSITISEAVVLSGGLRRDASNVAVIYRKDPLKPKELQYLRVDVKNAIEDPTSEDNLLLMPFDRLEILSGNDFLEEAFVSVKGAVNNPGSFQYGENMTVKDLLTLSGGFQFAAATNKIEVSRVVIKDNEPTKIIIANIKMDRDLNVLDGEGDGFVLNPYDILVVRYVPEFEFQKNIQIIGEVQFPGPYTIINENEQISNIIVRAGGLTEEAFTTGATIYRKENEIGYIILRLDEVLKDENSRYNYILKDGDIIEIPKKKDFVTIQGATNADEVFNKQFLNKANGLVVAFHDGKNAKFYIDNYAGGLDESASKKLIYVQHPNGEIEQTKRILFWQKYPKVRKGSVINVGVKPPKPIKAEGEKDDVDWTKVLTDSVAQAMSILTLIVLIQRLD